MTPSTVGRPRRQRPARVAIAVIVLVVVAALGLLFAVRNVLGYAGSAEYDGIANRMSFLEFLADAPDRILLPLGLAGTAGAAAFGIARRRRWGQLLEVVLGGLLVLGGMALLLTALREWALPGSFAALLVPPAVLAVLVGGYLVFAALTSESYFAEG